ncbi:MAG: hypothetical protein IJ091_08965 [Oscillospiraceae bacterium]|nr:hypothetical protein [Oscillospiraceae bacterium]
MDIRKYSGQELVQRLDTGKLSILNAIGAHDLKKEMVHVGKLCSFVVHLVCLGKDDTNLRKRAVSVIRFAAPAKLLGKLPTSEHTVVIGFNHPSLGEVCRLLYLGFLRYPDREFLFPVNLPWYESIVPVIPQLKRLGIHISPMITPATEAKLNKKFEGDDAKLKDVQLLKMIFDHRYIREIKAMSEKNGIIFVAPSATRQKEIIGDPVHPSMTALAHLVHKGNRRSLFVPVAVFAPKHGNRELNLFRSYYIEPCRPFEAEEVQELVSGRDRAFDYAFLKRIEKVYKQRAKKLHLD